MKPLPFDETLLVRLFCAQSGHGLLGEILRTPDGLELRYDRAEHQPKGSLEEARQATGGRRAAIVSHRSRPLDLADQDPLTLLCPTCGEVSVPVDLAAAAIANSTRFASNVPRLLLTV